VLLWVKAFLFSNTFLPFRALDIAADNSCVASAEGIISAGIAVSIGADTHALKKVKAKVDRVKLFMIETN